MSYRYVWTDGTELYHHGIKGQKWGIRRYQNPDGTLTKAGKDKLKEQRKFLTKGAITSGLSAGGIGLIREAIKSAARPVIQTISVSAGFGPVALSSTKDYVVREGAKWAISALKVANPTLAVALGATAALSIGSAYVAQKLKNDERLHENLKLNKNN